MVAHPGARPPGTMTRPVSTCRTRVPTGPSLGSRVTRAGLPSRLSRSTRRAACVVVPAPSMPSSTTSLPLPDAMFGAGAIAQVGPGGNPSGAFRRKRRRILAQHDVVDEACGADTAGDHQHGARPDVVLDGPE